MIDFPAHIVSTPCKTRTFSLVLPAWGDTNKTQAVHLESTFPNTPMVLRKRNGAPGFYYGWAHGQMVTPLTFVYRHGK